ncbi:MAG: host attachment protein [Hyphomicrobium sp.]|jgi:protein required for attachment to host cells
MKPTTTWILIADGARGRLFANRGPGKGLELLDESLDADHRATHDIVDDRLGRTHESVGASRHAISARHDPHRELKRDFAVRLAKMLDRRRSEHAYDRLVLVAPPSALGDLREALSDSVRSLVRAELDKDLTKTPIAELPEHLGAVLAV